ncbi:hypothetical protein TrVE_jg3766 [Triparma verrucosa]|uniref:Uncharacterized protein n=1 Tax=Triparma verrucosa TaxID=1606542 RepID=A0A9W7KXD8_9STRA|nr:hypothetical protein TrVE_jg3766 [Triparma verrucosa]
MPIATLHHQGVLKRKHKEIMAGTARITQPVRKKPVGQGPKRARPETHTTNREEGKETETPPDDRSEKGPQGTPEN